MAIIEFKSVKYFHIIHIIFINDQIANKLTDHRKIKRIIILIINLFTVDLRLNILFS